MTAIPMSLARLAREHWPIVVGEPHLVMHRENSVFQVETVHGPAALRLHRPHYHSYTALESELNWMAMLASQGMHVPAPYVAGNGEFLVRLSDGATERMADLLTWLGGTPLGTTGEALSTDPKIFRDIGAAMARMHNYSDRWIPPVGFTRPDWDLDGLVGETPFWGRFWEVSGIGKVETELLVRVQERCREDLSFLIGKGLDYGLIHADLVRENIIVSDSGIGFIDFDDSGFGFRMFDIATALLKNRNEVTYEAIERNLLAGYESERELASHEKEALPLFLVLRSLTYLGWAEARRGEPGIERRRERFLADALALSSAYLSAP